MWRASTSVARRFFTVLRFASVSVTMRYHFMESLQAWEVELMKLAGVMLSIDHDGRSSYV